MKTGFAAEPSYEPDYAEKRMAEFKEDPENMKIVQDFVDDVLRIAQMESEQKLKSQQVGCISQLFSAGGRQLKNSSLNLLWERLITGPKGARQIENNEASMIASEAISLTIILAENYACPHTSPQFKNKQNWVLCEYCYYI